MIQDSKTIETICEFIGITDKKKVLSNFENIGYLVDYFEEFRNNLAKKTLKSFVNEFKKSFIYIFVILVSFGFGLTGKIVYPVS